MGIELATGVDDGGRQGVLAMEEADHLHDVVDTIDIEVVDHSGLAGILCREDETFVAQLAGFDGDGQGATDGHEAAVESQLTHDEVARQFVGHDHVARRHDAYGNGQVIGRALLADVGRSHVDGDLRGGHLVARVEQGGTDALMALLDSRIGKSHEEELHSTRCVHLDGDDGGIDTLHGGSEDFDQHSITFSSYFSPDSLPERESACRPHRRSRGCGHEGWCCRL